MNYDRNQFEKSSFRNRIWTNIGAKQQNQKNRKKLKNQKIRIKSEKFLKFTSFPPISEDLAILIIKKVIGIMGIINYYCDNRCFSILKDNSCFRMYSLDQSIKYSYKKFDFSKFIGEWAKRLSEWAEPTHALPWLRHYITKRNLL